MEDLLWRDFTEQEKERIDYMIKAGYGWGKYARSLKKQSKISAKQSETLDEMYCRLYNQQSSHKYKPSYRYRGSKSRKRELEANDGWGYVSDVSDYGSGYYDV